MSNQRKVTAEPFSGIRQRAEAVDRNDPLPKALASPADTPESFLVVDLNDRWRVIDDPLQWILQVRTGRRTTKATGWRSRSHCVEREALLRCIREYCGSVDAAAGTVIKALPEFHPRRDVPEARD